MLNIFHMALYYNKFVFRCLTDKEMACGGLPFPGAGCPVSDVDDIYFVWDFYCRGYCYYIYPPPYDVSVYRLSFRIKHRINNDGPTLYQIYMFNWGLSAGGFQV